MTEALRALVARLEAGEAPAPILEAFGERLLAHVRAEERGLFEQAQAILGDETLDWLFGGRPNEDGG